MNEIVYKSLAKKLNRARTIPGRHKCIEGVEQLDKIIAIDQSPIGRTPRSNPGYLHRRIRPDKGPVRLHHGRQGKGLQQGKVQL